MTPGAVLTNKIREAASKIGARLFVMTTGKFWQGQIVNQTDTTITLKNPRLVSVGFEGLSDLVGFTPVTITQDMVGETVAIFVAVEVKTTDSPSCKQRSFVDVIEKNGGKAGFARSVENARSIITD